MLAAVAAVVVVAAVVAALVTVAASRGDLFGRAEPAAAAAAQPAAVVADPLAPVPSDAPRPTPAGLASALAPVLNNPDLGTLTGRVADALTGTSLWSRDPDVAQAPGSVAKVLTAAAALLTLPMDQRLSTTVVAGATPGQVVLVGGGDATITAQPPGSQGYYPGAARLDDLVDQVRASGRSVTSVVVDASRFPGPTLASGWNPVDIPGGSIAPIEAVMLDGGRLNPTQDYSPRSATPALDAGRTLAQRLGVDPATVTIGTAPPGADALATVHSAPLSTRLHYMMVVSDDVTAETIGLEIAAARDEPETFGGAVAAVTDTLAEAGFDTAGVRLSDVSGLSTDDRLPARLIDEVLLAVTGDGTHAEKLRPMVDDLAVGGGSGTLWDRFVSPSPGAGWVRGKTGTLDGVNALAGMVTDVDGRVLVFTLMSNGTPSEVAKPALDAVAVALRECGCR